MNSLKKSQTTSPVQPVSLRRQCKDCCQSHCLIAIWQHSWKSKKSKAEQNCSSPGAVCGFCVVWMLSTSRGHRLCSPLCKDERESIILTSTHSKWDRNSVIFSLLQSKREESLLFTYSTKLPLGVTWVSSCSLTLLKSVWASSSTQRLTRGKVVKVMCNLQKDCWKKKEFAIRMLWYFREN